MYFDVNLWGVILSSVLCKMFHQVPSPTSMSVIILICWNSLDGWIPAILINNCTLNEVIIGDDDSRVGLTIDLRGGLWNHEAASHRMELGWHPVALRCELSEGRQIKLSLCMLDCGRAEVSPRYPVDSVNNSWVLQRCSSSSGTSTSRRLLHYVLLLSLLCHRQAWAKLTSLPGKNSIVYVKH